MSVFRTTCFLLVILTVLFARPVLADDDDDDDYDDDDSDIETNYPTWSFGGSTGSWSWNSIWQAASTFLSQLSPSPSPSPAPAGTGYPPLYVGFKTSNQGLNHESYFHFTLNQLFYNEQEEQPSQSVYEEYKDVLLDLTIIAEDRALSYGEAILWQQVADATIRSYRQERGAIFFDIAFSHRWKYCGWVDMSDTFVDTDKHMRFCASLISLGMDDVTRTPENGKDFIIPGQSDSQQIESLITPALTTATRQSLKNTERDDEEEYQDVDLLGYPTYCSSNGYLEIEANCYSMCCMTPYYGSQFCNDCMF